MPKTNRKQVEICQQDCPPVPAPKYPGAYSKDNPNGSIISKAEYIDCAVKSWVEHFEESEKYENTSLSKKVLYLTQHLHHYKTKRLTHKEIRKLLVKAEIILEVNAHRKETDSNNQEKGIDNEAIDEGILNNESVEAMEEGESETLRMDIGEGEDGQSEIYIDQNHNMDNLVDGTSGLVSDIGKQPDQNNNSESESSASDDSGSESDMFDCDSTDAEDIGEIERSSRDIEIKKWLAMSDSELFEMDKDVPHIVERSLRYNKRKNDFVKNYIEEKDFQNSQDILESFSQNPNIVKTSKNLKRKIDHLTYEDRANKLVLQSVSNTIAQLRQTPGSAARDQLKVVLSSTTHHRWGTPALEEKLSWRLKKEAKEMKINLLTGKEPLLTPPPKKKRKVIPEEVEDIAVKHWTETTIPEPSVQRRMKRKEKKKKRSKEETEEIVPTRWQHLSQREQYANFKDECSSDISEVMKKHGEESISKLESRPDSEDKQRRLELYRNMHEKFPSESWYLDQKPPEVKPLCDHTTGLCRICEAASLNYTTLNRNLKRLCGCKTDRCPNWICFCDPDEDEACSCQCDCDSCSKCKVCITI